MCRGDTFTKAVEEGALKYSNVRGNLIDARCIHLQSLLASFRLLEKPEGPPNMLLVTELILVQLIQVEEEKAKDTETQKKKEKKTARVLLLLFSELNS